MGYFIVKDEGGRATLRRKAEVSAEHGERLARFARARLDHNLDTIEILARERRLKPIRDAETAAEVDSLLRGSAYRPDGTLRAGFGPDGADLSDAQLAAVKAWRKAQGLPA